MRARLAGCIAGCLVLAECSSPASLNPVEWWHDLEGGRIASTRPPPPNADAPYPNLASVPSRPAAIDAAARGRIANSLVADRANAQYGASIAPLTPAGAPPPRPPASAAPQGDMSASLDAASKPPAPPAPPVAAPTPTSAPPRRAPVGAVAAAPLAAPPAPAPAEPAPTPTAAAAGAAAADVAAFPGIPDRPPPPPSIAGAGVPATTVPTPPPPTPPAPPAPPLAPGEPVAVPFPAGSAVLPAAVQGQLKTLAQRRGNASIAVAGYGEALSSEPADQSAALPLALERAHAIASVLQAAGVPASALHITAEAAGRGGVARIAD
ncbi:OmpA family protein [Limobrevibacterium gyesilva]|uniref:OmpA-like domain-containing protein n=1 Tax=Limobrevibacterium gyesilva TaxID=2991712 RepID=A0AA42CHG6_9PROT|nr:OmpA family protein [Limobrevibacterium gyesilva]MCW3474962.1 hypothetical protein [Limobrevibacterium gyesilva]